MIDRLKVAVANLLCMCSGIALCFGLAGILTSEKTIAVASFIATIVAGLIGRFMLSEAHQEHQAQERRAHLLQKLSHR